jgi:hypothetical protein
MVQHGSHLLQCGISASGGSKAHDSKDALSRVDDDLLYGAPTLRLERLLQHFGRMHWGKGEGTIEKEMGSVFIFSALSSGRFIWMESLNCDARERKKERRGRSRGRSRRRALESKERPQTDRRPPVAACTNLA